jgi:hypothetical protein
VLFRRITSERNERFEAKRINPKSPQRLILADVLTSGLKTKREQAVKNRATRGLCDRVRRRSRRLAPEGLSVTHLIFGGRYRNVSDGEAQHMLGKTLTAWSLR